MVSAVMPAVSAARELPREFTANYALEIFGTVLARATYTLQHTENGLTMTQSTRPVGLVALLRKDRIDVRSDMVVNDGRLLLVNYDYTHTGDDEDRNVRLEIKWQANHNQELSGRATGVYEGRKVDLQIDKPVWDPLSIQVPIMLDAEKNLPPHDHGLFMKGEFKDYRFENLGQETVRFDGTKFDAVKIVGRETERDRAMYVWMLPELNNMPVKIEQWKDGKLKSTVTLESVSLEQDGKIRTLSRSDSADDYE